MQKALCLYKDEAVLTDTAMEIRSPLASYCDFSTTALQSVFTNTVPCTNKLSAGICIFGKPKETAMPTFLSSNGT